MSHWIPLVHIIHAARIFSELYDSNTEEEIPIPLGPARDTTVLDSDFTEDEVAEALAGAKDRKSCGLDGLPNEVWKEAKPVLIHMLTKLFNAMYRDCYFPNIWRSSIIVPLHKKGATNVPSNYRGLSLVPCINNIFISMFSKRPMKFAGENSIILETQAAFLYILDSIIHKYVYTNKSSLYILYVDFSKAYDLVIRHNLWTKLAYYGVSVEMIKYMKEIYRDVRACVKVGSHQTTDCFPSIIGLRQGDKWSCIGFVLFLNDLADHLIGRDVQGIDIRQLYVILLVYYAGDLCIIDKSGRGMQTI